MSPILVRPVREQLEHDRVIRQLQARYKRKFEVAINPGNTQTMPVGTGPSAWYPDLVLQSTERSRKLLGVVEVETAESVNHLEAMSQWAALSKLRAPFHLYVPTASIDNTRRLCADLQIPVAEMWTYQVIGDQLRFTLVQRSTSPGNGKRPSDTAAASSRRVATERPVARPVRRAPGSAAGSRRTSPPKSKAAAPRRASTATRARKGASSSSRAQKRK